MQARRYVPTPFVYAASEPVGPIVQAMEALLGALPAQLTKSHFRRAD
jgi:hypothetical protein